ncbi:ATP-binding cassette domain-containing protein, partial [Acinetobacter baumannii]
TAVGVRVGRHRLVDNVSLALASGELMVVVGPNGAGKTTLMKLLTGEMAPTEGAIRLDSDDIRALPAWRLAGKRAVMA